MHITAGATAPAVVITRPRAQAEAFAPHISALGLQPVLFPLLDICPLDADDSAVLKKILKDLSSYAMVVFVSPNAIDAAFHYIDRWPADVAIGIVGAGSRAALARHGVDASNAHIVAPLMSEQTDSEGLFAALDHVALQGRRVLIVRGQDGRDFLSEALRKIGAHVDHISAYRRKAPVLDSGAIDQLQQLLIGENCWIITSSEALGNLMQMLTQTALPDAVAKMQQKRIIVPHSRIAETARLAGFSRVTLTGSGDERLLAALQSDS